MGLLKQFGMASPEFLAWKEWVDERVQNIGSIDETLIQNINDINKRTLPIKGTIQAGETLNLQTSLPDYIFNGNYKFFDVTCNSEYLTASFKIMSGWPYIELKNNATKSIQYELYISPKKIKKLSYTLTSGTTNKIITLNDLPAGFSPENFNVISIMTYTIIPESDVHYEKTFKNNSNYDLKVKATLDGISVSRTQLPDDELVVDIYYI